MQLYKSNMIHTTFNHEYIHTFSWPHLLIQNQSVHKFIWTVLIVKHQLPTLGEQTETLDLKSLVNVLKLIGVWVSGTCHQPCATTQNNLSTQTISSQEAREHFVIQFANYCYFKHGEAGIFYCLCFIKNLSIRWGSKGLLQLMNLHALHCQAFMKQV